MPHTIRIATWNIAGARKMRSLDRFDYESEEITYFTECLQKVSPDIICIQESHTSEERSIAAALAEQLRMPYVHNDTVSPSHIDESYKLSNAVIAAFELRHVKNVVYPYPAFGHTLASGKPSRHHDKILQIFEYEGLTVANTQMLPLGIFGRSYDTEEGAVLAKGIESVLIENLKRPLVLCGDINFDKPSAIYPDFFDTLKLRDALPDVLTRPNKEGIKKTPDHIIVSPEITVLNSEVIPVAADHYLCVADITF